LKRKGRPPKHDYEEIDQYILDFLDPSRTIDMKRGYPTRKVWEFVNHHCRCSRRRVFERLMLLEKRGLLKKSKAFNTWYWKGKVLPRHITTSEANESSFGNKETNQETSQNILCL